MSEAELTDHLDQWLEDHKKELAEPKQDQSLGSVIKEWWGPITALVVILGSWFGQREGLATLKEKLTVVEQELNMHERKLDIHASDETKRLQIIDQTEDMRKKLDEFGSNQRLILADVRAIKDELVEVKKSLNN